MDSYCANYPASKGGCAADFGSSDLSGKRTGTRAAAAGKFDARAYYWSLGVDR